MFSESSSGVHLSWCCSFLGFIFLFFVFGYLVASEVPAGGSKVFVTCGDFKVAEGERIQSIQTFPCRVSERSAKRVAKKP